MSTHHHAAGGDPAGHHRAGAPGAGHHEEDGVDERRITVTVNGEPTAVEIEPRLLLAHLLREGLGLTGTHLGCDTTNCGACTVLLDGTPVKSCTMLAVQADGHDVTTVEGLGSASELDPVQEGFSVEHGLQCGFCTPGMMLTAKALLEENPRPTEEDVRWALSGNLCRCTGYQNIVKAVLWAADKSAGPAADAPAGDGTEDPAAGTASADTPATV
jgi:carbon-monoxide dehydrogenase small subunit